MLDNGCKMVIQFINSWQTLVSKSHAAKHKFLEYFGFKCPYVTNYTRWYSKYEVVESLGTKILELEKFLLVRIIFYFLFLILIYLGLPE